MEPHISQEVSTGLFIRIREERGKGWGTALISPNWSSDAVHQSVVLAGEGGNDREEWEETALEVNEIHQQGDKTRLIVQEKANLLRSEGNQLTPLHH